MGVLVSASRRRQRAMRELVRLDWKHGELVWRIPIQSQTILRVATCKVMVLCASIRTRPPQHRARPFASASATSSANLAPTKTRQNRHPAKHVRLESIKIRLRRVIAKLVKRENTMIKRNVRQSLIVKLVELANTTTKHNAQQNLLANLIATPDHTSHLTKVHVSFVRKVSGKIKIDSQIAPPVTLENITMKRKKQQNPIAKIVTLENTTVLMIRQRKTNMTRKLIASPVLSDKLRMAKQPNLIVRPVQQDGI